VSADQADAFDNFGQEVLSLQNWAAAAARAFE
jgi:hypothetical protein